ncbi:MAG: S41 family peptidase [Gemmataceae bacterium]
MNRMFGFLMVGILAMAGSLQAQENAAKGKAYGLLIGVGAYKDGQIKARPNAEKDVLAIAKVLSDPGHLGVAKEDLRVVLSNAAKYPEAIEASKANILKELNWLAKAAGPTDRVYLVMIGSGGPLGDTGDRRGYFATDTTFAGRNEGAISSADIGDILKTCKSDRFVSFVDVNFNGFTAMGRGVAEATLGQNPYKEFLGDDGTDEHGPANGHVVYLANIGLSPSFDLEGHGVFGKVIADGLDGKADKDGYEPDGLVTVDELSEYLVKTLPEICRKDGKTKIEKEQMPIVLGGLASHYVLTNNPPGMAKSNARIEAFAKLVASNQAVDKFKTEGNRLLARMPKLEAQRSLRKDYQALIDGKVDLAAFENTRSEIIESTKLTEADAGDFAQQVIKATRIIRDNYVKAIKQPDMVKWAINGLYKRIEETVPPQIEEKLKDLSAANEEKLTQLLVEARVALGKREDLEKHKDIDITLQRMMSNLDPYTNYIDAETKAAFDKEVQGNFTGIGVQIRKDSATDMLLVVTPIKGSPAYKAGVQAGDLITKIVRPVDNEGNVLETPEEISTIGMSTQDAVKKILGKKGTKVTIFIQREGEAKPREVSLLRGQVEVESVFGFKRDANDDWDFFIDPKTKIAYLRLSNFARFSARDLIKSVEELRKKGLNGLVFDMRFNPGGLLDAAVAISDYFIDDGLIVTIRPRLKDSTVITGRTPNSVTDFPIAILVNGGSASGSEIVAAALQDHGRAYVFGERSYGKGSVQNIQPFGEGEIKLTTATFWRPNGKNLNKSSTKGKEEEDWGVVPNEALALTRKEREDLQEHLRDTEIIQPKVKPASAKEKPKFEDKQLEAALKYLKSQIKIAGIPGAKSETVED